MSQSDATAAPLVEALKERGFRPDAEDPEDFVYGNVKIFVMPKPYRHSLGVYRDGVPRYFVEFDWQTPLRVILAAVDAALEESDQNGR